MRMMLVMMLAACSGTPAHPTTNGSGSGGSAMIDKTKTGPTDHAFTKGVDTSSADKLTAWLDANKGKLLRVGVTLSKGMMGYGNADAKLGALSIYLDDSALGIGIADHARKCKDQPSCAMLLEGYWEGKGMGGDLELRVMRMVEIVDASKVPAFVEVETAAADTN